MAEGRSLTPFYVVLAVLAIGGGALVLRSTLMKPLPPLSLETAGLPLSTGPRGVTIGSDSAPVELMEFSDFECPWCARYAVLQMPDIKQRLIPDGRLRVRFVHYPLNGHQKSPFAHLAAACGHEQGRFWEMHDLIFENQEEWYRAENPDRFLTGYAERAGLDMDRYRSCVSERRMWNQVLADKALGDSLGISGTPTFYVNGRPIEGTASADQIAAMVDSIAPRTPAAAPR